MMININRNIRILFKTNGTTMMCVICPSVMKLSDTYFKYYYRIQGVLRFSSKIQAVFFFNFDVHGFSIHD